MVGVTHVFGVRQMHCVRANRYLEPFEVLRGALSDQRRRDTELLSPDAVRHVLPCPWGAWLFRWVLLDPVVEVVEPHFVCIVAPLRRGAAKGIQPAQHVVLEFPVAVGERILAPRGGCGELPL